MSESSPEPRRPRSARVVLARLAEAIIDREPTVEATAGVGLWMTLDGSERILGVVSNEAASGSVEVELHLIARWPAGPLPQLAEGIREELREAASAAGLGERLGEIAVTIHDIDFGDEGAVA